MKTAETAAPALDRLLRAVEASGARLLDPVWRGWLAQYRLQCAQGHVWTRTANHVVFYGPCACPQCTAEQRLAHLAAAVAQTGSVCLDTVWKGSNARYRFRCSAGHAWERAARDVLWGGRTCCPQCMRRIGDEKRRVPDGLERLQAAAAAKGGQCLAEDYVGVSARYRFLCDQGHEWETVGHEVLQGTWCKRCANGGTREKLAQELARLRAVVEERGGVFLSETYTGQNRRYRFRCAHGHEWESFGGKILRGSWCRRCAQDAQMLGIALFRALAEARGGKCLSEVYRGVKVKLTWSCHRGHVWEAVPDSIKKGHWCPHCAHANKITRGDSKARMRYAKSALHGKDAGS